ncbi:MAG: recombinase family protein [Ruthenibacterium sp.]
MNTENIDTRPVADIIARYSTDNQNYDTIEVQVEKCKEWCEIHGYRVAEIFTDEGVSGMKKTRAGYEACIQHVSMGRAQLVVVYDQSRMFRKFQEWFNFRDLIASFGAGVASVTQPLLGGDILDPSVFINEAAMAMLNHVQVLVTRQKTIAALEHNVKAGKTAGGRPPLGFDINAEKHYVINEYEANAVRTIFEMFADGDSYGRMIDTLNEQGYKTKRGQAFGKNSIHEILKNEKYIGRLIYGATKASASGAWNNHNKDVKNAIVVEDAMPAIIEIDIWYKVQSKMKTRQGNGGRYSAKREYLLTGRVFCGDCQSSMVVMGSKGSGYQYYECNHKRRTHTCSMKNVRVDWLEHTAAESIKYMLTEPANFEKLVQVAEEQQRNLTSTYDTRKAELSARYAKTCLQLDRAVQALLDGVSSDELKRRIPMLEAEKKEIELESKQMESSGPFGLDADTIRQAVNHIAAADIETEEGRKAILSIVKRIEIHKDDIDIVTIIDGNEPPTGGGKPQTDKETPMADTVTPEAVTKEAKSTIHRNDSGRVTIKVSCKR